MFCNCINAQCCFVCMAERRGVPHCSQEEQAEHRAAWQQQLEEKKKIKRRQEEEEEREKIKRRIDKEKEEEVLLLRSLENAECARLKALLARFDEQGKALPLTVKQLEDMLD